MKLISRKGTFEVNDFDVNNTLDIVFSADTLIMKAKKNDEKNENNETDKNLNLDADRIELQDIIPIASIVRIPVDVNDAQEGKEMFLDILKIGNTYTPIGYGYPDEKREGELVYTKDLTHLRIEFDENGNLIGNIIPISEGNIDIEEIMSNVEVNFLDFVVNYLEKSGVLATPPQNKKQQKFALMISTNNLTLKLN